MTRCALLVLVLVTACQKKPTDTSATAAPVAELGKERADCRPDKTCDPGLLCLSNLCVRPPPADCTSVGETLASFELGNYAPVEERAPVVAKYKAQCEKVYVTKEQGQCLDKTRDKWSAAQCAPALFPELAVAGGECRLLAAKMDHFLERQWAANKNDYMTKYRAAMVATLRDSCEQDHWPVELTKCGLTADLSRNAQSMPYECNQLMTPELQQKMQQRLAEAMQKING
jgi:hypothetical protein